MSYTVSRSRRCIVVDGAIPLVDMGALLTVWSREMDDLLVDGELSNKLGCNMVVGQRADLDAWRAELGMVFP